MKKFIKILIVVCALMAVTGLGLIGCENPTSSEDTPVYTVSGSITTSDGGNVRGSIITSDELAITGIEITLKDSAGAPNGDVTVNEEAKNYTVTGVPAGTYTLIAALKGYRTFCNSVVVESDTTQSITLQTAEPLEAWTQVSGYAAAGGGGGYVTFGNGKFVSCSYVDGSAAWSSDGIKWNAITKETTTFNDSYIKFILWTGEKFWAVGNNGHIATFTDPSGTWTKVDSDILPTDDDKPIYSIGFNPDNPDNASNGTLIAVTEHPMVIKSTDGGKTWTDITKAAKDVWNEKYDTIVYGNGTWVIGCNGGPVLVSKDDGGTWTKYTFSSPIGGTNTNHIKMIAFGAGKFVAVTRYGLAVSADGANWTWHELYPFVPGEPSWDAKVWLNSVTYADGYFVVGGGQYVGVIAYSTDGGDTWQRDGSKTGDWWTRTDGQSKNVYFNGEAYGNGKFVMTGGDAKPVAIYTEVD